VQTGVAVGVLFGYSVERSTRWMPSAGRNKQVIAILSKPIDRIGIADIESLIALNVSESEQIEFKAGLSAKAHSADRWMSGEGKIGNRARNALLQEVTAFANAFGGTLILGMRESDAKPPVAEEIAPLPRCTELSERLKLMFRDCVEPPLQLIEIVGVPIQDKSGVVVIRVGKSRLAPHRVTTTLRCPIRRQDRCEKMTMREIQDMTLNVSRGLERLKRRLEERADRFPKEFNKLSDPQNAFGIRMTALPVGNEIRFDRVFSQHHIIEELQEPWRKVIQTKSNGEQINLDDLPHESKPNFWRPMRAARAEPDSNFRSAKRELSSYREIHCDGLIEWALLSCETSPMEEDTCPLSPKWPIMLLANQIAWAHRVREVAGAPMAEYAIEIEIFARGSGVKVVNPGNNNRLPWLGLLTEGSMKFPRYSLGDTDEVLRLLILFKRDFWNSLGRELDADEGVLKIENWPDQEPDYGT